MNTFWGHLCSSKLYNSPILHISCISSATLFIFCELYIAHCQRQVSPTVYVRNTADFFFFGETNAAEIKRALKNNDEWIRTISVHLTYLSRQPVWDHDHWILIGDSLILLFESYDEYIEKLHVQLLCQIHN